jgi:hypothetical protein
VKDVSSAPFPGAGANSGDFGLERLFPRKIAKPLPPLVT